MTQPGTKKSSVLYTKSTRGIAAKGPVIARLHPDRGIPDRLVVHAHKTTETTDCSPVSPSNSRSAAGRATGSADRDFGCTPVIIPHIGGRNSIAFALYCPVQFLDSNRVLRPSCVMLIGYASVSTNEQDTAAQATALRAAKCERIYREKAAGGRWDRPELHRLLDQLRKGDILLVWKLDRLSGSLRDVLTIMERLAEAKAGFRSLTEAIDTTTLAGRMMMQMVGAFAEFERAMLKEPTKTGLEAARREGRIGGRRPKLSTSTAVPRSHGLCREATRQRLMRPGCSAFTRRPSRDCYPRRGLLAVPSVQWPVRNGRVRQIALKRSTQS